MLSRTGGSSSVEPPHPPQTHESHLLQYLGDFAGHIMFSMYHDSVSRFTMMILSGIQDDLGSIEYLLPH